MDITDIHMPDNVFDVIYCSHVFEHIPDDRKAMRELFRVLKPGGWAILQVPQDITMQRTKEGNDEMTLIERETEFGHHDHLRLYGLDYGDRLEDACFDVTVVDFATELEPEKVFKYGLKRDEPIYHCTKRVLTDRSVPDLQSELEPRSTTRTLARAQ